MAKLAIDRASIVFGKKLGDFHSKSGDREIFIILSKIGRSPEKSGDLEALNTGRENIINDDVICDKKVSLNLKDNIYHPVISPTVLRGSECWVLRKKDQYLIRSR